MSQALGRVPDGLVRDGRTSAFRLGVARYTSVPVEDVDIENATLARAAGVGVRSTNRST